MPFSFALHELGIRPSSSCKGGGGGLPRGVTRATDPEGVRYELDEEETVRREEGLRSEDEKEKDAWGAWRLGLGTISAGREWCWREETEMTG